MNLPWFLGFCSATAPDAATFVPAQAALVPSTVLSNFAVWIAHPNMAPLSAVLTCVSMLITPIATPLLSRLLLGSPLSVADLPPMAMALAAVKVRHVKSPSLPAAQSHSVQHCSKCTLSSRK